MRRHLGLIVRILFSGGILVYLARKLDWAKLGQVVLEMQPGWMVWAALVFIPVIVLATERWRLLLQVQGVHLSRPQTMQLFLVGHFFNQFLLGTTGGDVVKMFYVAQAAPDKKSAAALSVFMDRIMGLIALLFWATGLAIVHYAFLTQKPETLAAVWSVFLFSAAALGGIVLAAVAPRLGRVPILARWGARLPGQKILNQLHEALVRYATAPRALLGALGLSLVLHGLAFLQNYWVALALWKGEPFAPGPFLSVLPVILFLTALPISISGLGVREGLSVLFFGLCGISVEYATAMSLSIFMLNLLWGLVGGLVYVCYDARQKMHPDFSPQRL